jgi:hypothetical protein
MPGTRSLSPRPELGASPPYATSKSCVMLGDKCLALRAVGGAGVFNATSGEVSSRARGGNRADRPRARQSPDLLRRDARGPRRRTNSTNSPVPNRCSASIAAQQSIDTDAHAVPRVDHLRNGDAKAQMVDRIVNTRPYRSAPTRSRAPAPSRPTDDRGSPRRSDGRCDTTSSPTAPARTTPAAPASTRHPSSFTATRECEHRVHQHLPAIMQRKPLTPRRDPRRELRAEPELIRETAQRVQPNMSDDPAATGLDPRPCRAGCVHPSGALSCAFSVVSQRQEKHTGRPLVALNNPRHPRTGERSGLVQSPARKDR